MQNKPSEIIKFRKVIWNYYYSYGRHTLPWRRTRDPYRILVSEIMLQQTQVERVLKFYPKFIRAFPDFTALARAPLKSVLKYWQGMGYNRRALALKKIAQKVITEFHGRLPHDLDELQSLSGIGQATAGAIAAFAFNRPVVFIETNIRRVFIFYFFTHRHPGHDPGSREKIQTKKRHDVSFGFLDSRLRGNDRRVSDQEILKFVKLTLDRKNPREWYWALMDYGAMLGKIERDNPNRRSSAYRRQSKFEGSRRQLRGEVLRLLLKKKNVSKAALKEFSAVLPELLQEGFIRESKGEYRLV